MLLEAEQAAEELVAAHSCVDVKTCRVVKREAGHVTVLDVVQVHVKDFGEARPQHEDRELLKHRIEHIKVVHTLHLLLALIVRLNHDQD